MSGTDGDFVNPVDHGDGTEPATEKTEGDYVHSVDHGDGTTEKTETEEGTYVSTTEEVENDDYVNPVEHG